MLTYWRIFLLIKTENLKINNLGIIPHCGGGGYSPQHNCNPDIVQTGVGDFSTKVHRQNNWNPDIVQTGVGDVPIKVHKQYNWNLDIVPIGVEDVPMKVHRQSN